MSLADSLILGKLTDLLDPELTQEEKNEESLFIYNQEELIKKISVKISRYEIDFLVDEVKEKSPLEYWLRILKTLIKKYSLNPLKSLLNNEYHTLNQREVIIELLYFMKVELPKIVIEKRISISLDRTTLKSLFKNTMTPKSFLYTLKYIDNDSLERMLKEIIKESKQEYTED